MPVQKNEGVIEDFEQMPKGGIERGYGVDEAVVLAGMMIEYIKFGNYKEQSQKTLRSFSVVKRLLAKIYKFADWDLLYTQ